MTTTVKIHVNGDYRATVVQKAAALQGGQCTTIIDGDPPGGCEKYFSMYHPAEATFEIREEPLTAEMKAAREAA